jgi:hypothetical protein
VLKFSWTVDESPAGPPRNLSGLIFADISDDLDAELMLTVGLRLGRAWGYHGIKTALCSC